MDGLVREAEIAQSIDQAIILLEFIHKMYKGTTKLPDRYERLESMLNLPVLVETPPCCFYTLLYFFPVTF